MPEWSAAQSAQWSARRWPPRVLHLDSAAAGRPSRSTLEAVAAHARLESEVGAYVAQEAVAEVGDRLRADVAGLLGVPPDGVAFVESATTALTALLGAWPLAPGARIGVVPAEWGPNVERFARHGYGTQLLPTDATGGLELDAFERVLATDPPAVVHLTQVASHRGLVQPVAEAARRCRAAAVPLWVDAAQAVGHVDAATGADAVYGTSRKWLTGPRGVGFLGVARPHWADLDVLRPRMAGDEHPPVR
jgi:pyridoxal 5-phosphate dependent beta-lyase